MLVGTPGLQQTMIKSCEMLVGTSGFQMTMIKNMGNVDRHTWFSADKGKIQWKCW